MKVLLENLLRFEDGRTVTKADIEACAKWVTNKGKTEKEIAFRPARVLMQDFTGVPAVVDLAAMRDAMTSLGGDPEKINPLVPVDLVIDHSVIVDEFGTPRRSRRTSSSNIQRNIERYNFLKWGQGAFDNFRVVPPGTGICHQVNLEYLSQTVWTRKEKYRPSAARRRRSKSPIPTRWSAPIRTPPWSTDLSVLGWGVGGIEAEACMLGQPLSMLLPEVIGFKLTGKLKEGVTATDLVLTVTQMLRKKGVVGKFVEFFGPGVDALTLADRATIGNMAPEYGATCGFFPVDGETHRLPEDCRAARRPASRWSRNTPRRRACIRTAQDARSGVHRLDVARPRRGRALHGRTEASGRPHRAGEASRPVLPRRWTRNIARATTSTHATRLPRKNYDIGHGDVVIAAITSCTNTSNPSVLIGAGLLARNAVSQGPDRKAVGEDLARARLAGRRRISRQFRPAEGSRQARLQPHRLWLHDLHRQFRSAR